MNDFFKNNLTVLVMSLFDRYMNKGMQCSSKIEEFNINITHVGNKCNFFLKLYYFLRKVFGITKR
jgi:hypothetical protein